MSDHDSAPMPLPDISSVVAGHRKLEESQRDIKRQVAAMAADLKTNTEATKRIETNTADLIAAFKAVQGLQTVLLWLVKMAIPLAIVWGGLKAYSLGVFGK